MADRLRNRYPGYDVLAKRSGTSWNDETRRVIDARLAVPRKPRFFTEAEWRTLQAVCDRIMPQPDDRPPVPLAAYVDDKMATNRLDGFRHVQLPEQGIAWRRGLGALDTEAAARHQQVFHRLDAAEQDALLCDMQHGGLRNSAWGDMPCALFFESRLLADILAAYYAHPTAWSEIGFGGPASPRGYVRLGLDRKDPWEATQAGDDSDAARARRENARVR